MTKSEDRVGPLKDTSGTITEDEQSMCDTLNNIFLLQFLLRKTLTMFRKLLIFLMEKTVIC